MRSSPCALAAMLAVTGLTAWAQVGDGPVQPMTAPPTIYSSSPPSAAIRQSAPSVQRAAPQPGVFAAAAVPTATRPSTEAREERRFLRDAAAQSRFELDAARQAFAKSGSGPVRTLAASLINHHGTIGLELAHLLNSRGMAMPMISNEQRKALNQLAKLTGARFDALFMQQVGLAQAAVARDYEKASAVIREPQLNGWIVKTAATTRYHQNMVERSLPADPHLAKLSRPAAKPQAARPAPQQAQGSPLSQATMGAAGAGGRLSVSDSQ